MFTEVMAAQPVQAPQRPAQGAGTRSIRPPVEEGQHLAFRLGSEEYAMDILRVQEIRGYAEPTRIANAPAFLKGVINLRGTIVPVVDLRVRLGAAEVGCQETTVTIVLDIGSRVVGVVVDSVSDVVQFTPDQVKPVPPCGPSADVDHVCGIATLRESTGDRMLIVVDVQRLVRDILPDADDLH